MQCPLPEDLRARVSSNWCQAVDRQWQCLQPDERLVVQCAMAEMAEYVDMNDVDKQLELVDLLQELRIDRCKGHVQELVLPILHHITPSTHRQALTIFLSGFADLTLTDDQVLERGMQMMERLQSNLASGMPEAEALTAAEQYMECGAEEGSDKPAGAAGADTSSNSSWTTAPSHQAASGFISLFSQGLKTIKGQRSLSMEETATDLFFWQSESAAASQACAIPLRRYSMPQTPLYLMHQLQRLQPGPCDAQPATSSMNDLAKESKGMVQDVPAIIEDGHVKDAERKFFNENGVQGQQRQSGADFRERNALTLTNDLLDPDHPPCFSADSLNISSTTFDGASSFDTSPLMSDRHTAAEDGRQILIDACRNCEAAEETNEEATEGLRVSPDSVLPEDMIVYHGIDEGPQLVGIYVSAEEEMLSEQTMPGLVVTDASEDIGRQDNLNLPIGISLGVISSTSVEGGIVVGIPDRSSGPAPAVPIGPSDAAVVVGIPADGECPTAVLGTPLPEATEQLFVQETDLLEPGIVVGVLASNAVGGGVIVGVPADITTIPIPSENSQDMALIVGVPETGPGILSDQALTVQPVLGVPIQSSQCPLLTIDGNNADGTPPETSTYPPQGYAFPPPATLTQDWIDGLLHVDGPLHSPSAASSRERDEIPQSFSLNLQSSTEVVFPESRLVRSTPETSEEFGTEDGRHLGHHAPPNVGIDPNAPSMVPCDDGYQRMNNRPRNPSDEPHALAPGNALLFCPLPSGAIASFEGGDGVQAGTHSNNAHNIHPATTQNEGSYRGANQAPSVTASFPNRFNRAKGPGNEHLRTVGSLNAEVMPPREESCAEMFSDASSQNSEVMPSTPEPDPETLLNDTVDEKDAIQFPQNTPMEQDLMVDMGDLDTAHVTAEGNAAAMLADEGTLQSSIPNNDPPCPIDPPFQMRQDPFLAPCNDNIEHETAGQVSASTIPEPVTVAQCHTIAGENHGSKENSATNLNLILNDNDEYTLYGTAPTEAAQMMKEAEYRLSGAGACQLITADHPPVVCLPADSEVLQEHDWNRVLHCMEIHPPVSVDEPIGVGPAIQNALPDFPAAPVEQAVRCVQMRDTDVQLIPHGECDARPGAASIGPEQAEEEVVVGDAGSKAAEEGEASASEDSAGTAAAGKQVKASIGPEQEEDQEMVGDACNNEAEEGEASASEDLAGRAAVGKQVKASIGPEQEEDQEEVGDSFSSEDSAGTAAAGKPVKGPSPRGEFTVGARRFPRSTRQASSSRERRTTIRGAEEDPEKKSSKANAGGSVRGAVSSFRGTASLSKAGQKGRNPASLQTGTWHASGSENDNVPKTSASPPQSRIRQTHERLTREVERLRKLCADMRKDADTLLETRPRSSLQPLPSSLSLAARTATSVVKGCLVRSLEGRPPTHGALGQASTSMLSNSSTYPQPDSPPFSPIRGPDLARRKRVIHSEERKATSRCTFQESSRLLSPSHRKDLDGTITWCEASSKDPHEHIDSTHRRHIRQGKASAEAENDVMQATNAGPGMWQAATCISRRQRNKELISLMASRFSGRKEMIRSLYADLLPAASSLKTRKEVEEPHSALIAASNLHLLSASTEAHTSCLVIPETKNETKRKVDSASSKRKSTRADVKDRGVVLYKDAHVTLCLTATGVALQT